ncbi:uncharacterized protein LOC133917758 [Phragmites australis]|uniref:uncharacterized protein LOC133917758 n=1 Tax=Phragmites australis TaxID=29695 RepID=UPI002D765957|nr:uncharacterized protein LOC133917758 [Phragmites australis]
MRTSLALATAVCFLLLLLTTMEVEAIRLDAESRAVVSQQTVNKSNENMVKDAPANSLGETKRSVAGKEVRATAHRLPEFHEDYYGASVHEPRHH